MNSEDEFDPAVSRLYQSNPKAAPSAALDEVILAQARESIEAIDQRVIAPGAQKSTWQRWLVPLSTAALLVMGISITVKIMNQPESNYQLSVPTSEQANESIYENEKSLKDEEVGQPDKASAPAAVMMFDARPEPVTESDSMQQEQPATPAREKKVASPMPSARSVERIEVQSEQLKRAMPTAAGVMNVAPETTDSDAIAEVPKESMQTEQKWPNPEAWLNHIKQLLEKNQNDEAMAELEHFRQNYPDYLIPEELQQILE
jgi:hypothetical protein